MKYSKYGLLEKRIIERSIKEQELKKKKNGNNGKIRHLTRQQRLWIHMRDEWRCRFNGCRCIERLEIHHIVPSFWAKYTLGWTDEEINSPFNTITLCHFDHYIMIHSMPKIEFDTVVQNQRKKFLDERPLWNTNFDDILLATAARRTEHYLEMYPDNPFPIKEYKQNGKF